MKVTMYCEFLFLALLTAVHSACTFDNLYTCIQTNMYPLKGTRDLTEVSDNNVYFIYLHLKTTMPNQYNHAHCRHLASFAPPCIQPRFFFLNICRKAYIIKVIRVFPPLDAHSFIGSSWLFIVTTPPWSMLILVGSNGCPLKGDPSAFQASLRMCWTFWWIVKKKHNKNINVFIAS